MQGTHIRSYKLVVGHETKYDNFMIHPKLFFFARYASDFELEQSPNEMNRLENLQLGLHKNDDTSYSSSCDVGFICESLTDEGRFFLNFIDQ